MSELISRLPFGRSLSPSGPVLYPLVLFRSLRSIYLVVVVFFLSSSCCSGSSTSRSSFAPLACPPPADGWPLSPQTVELLEHSHTKEADSCFQRPQSQRYSKVSARLMLNTDRLGGSLVLRRASLVEYTTVPRPKLSTFLRLLSCQLA